MRKEIEHKVQAESASTGSKSSRGVDEGLSSVDRRTVPERIRAMAMSEAERCAAIQDFERGQIIAEAVVSAARSIRRLAATTARILRLLATSSYRLRRRASNPRSQ
jgi:hypothetical protein